MPEPPASQDAMSPGVAEPGAEAAPDDAELPVAQLRYRPPAWLWWPSTSLRYQLHARGYALATAIRLTLPDAASREWLSVSLLHWLGTVVLFITGGAAGWALCLTAILLELLTLADQLTQTVYLGGVALAALVCFLGDTSNRGERLDYDLAAATRSLTVGTYFLAGFHKLNRDFLNPEVSCASGGIGVLSEHYGSSLIARVQGWELWPALFISAELGLVFLAIARPGLAVVVALAFHLPLTIIFAPAFAFTMASGWVCFLTESELRHLGRTLRERWRVILLLAAPPSVLSLGVAPHDRWRTDPDWCVKEALLWFALSWFVLAWARRRQALPHYGAWLGAWRELKARKRAALFAAVAASCWLANGFTPYLGLQFQHTGAMLSNLRIDAGCFNHLVIPEAVRLSEPYIRMDLVSFAKPLTEPEEDYRSQLYNSELLPPLTRRWCRQSPQGVRLQGVYGDAPFVIENACSGAPLPFEAPWLPKFRRFQQNLARECPQACVH